MKSNLRYALAKKVTLIGALINLILGIVKLIGGVFSHSHALIADGIHSFSDLLTDVMVLFASKYGSQEADASHPYGHQRIETAGTLILSLLLILAGIGIMWDSVIEILYKTHQKPKVWALFIAIFSILANEALFQYTRFIGNKIKSSLVTANAWHHRSDAASSFVVCLGLVGSLFGLIYLDAWAAAVVGMLIVKMGVDYGWNSVKELVDSAVSSSIIIEVERIILTTDGVKKIHQLRSRLMGNDIFIDVHVLVSPKISVSEGHYIAQQVHHRLLQQITEIKDVTVHIDPEDDESDCPSLHLPAREQLNELFLNDLKRRFPDIQSCTLHYLAGELIIDLLVTPFFVDGQALRKWIESEKNIPGTIASIRIYCLQDEILLAKMNR